ncbi:hypothetical protein PF005_g12017 [Phytophthora fragariae]|uniref:Dynein regulatory complex protein 10 n=1 Tax=Phytophthora fragariae TaxID=53985 RepID=A0A6A3KBZ8_9STRA|nr:hypothetical protein PF003_g28314 [Phytophthora fragariae]KAE8936839.1 hypothetical protein PF009_g13247 [Phytophthora fragariae]KAE9002235.1 hypothetical protein PF011_g13407 [Phytophthora fragariae]KAE9109290.1 hypothetical protein PF007_g12304 [Phytophthora fragariae]KAE9109396.1 hypothetical protein PF010_g11565 [Phytophthora fragariae]
MASLFQGTAWLLVEAKTTFYSPRYSPESVSVCRQSLPFWSQPQVVLQLGQTEYLVLNSSPADASKRSGDPKETKKLLQLTVRPLHDVRRAQLYQTAARAQVLELFVDVEHTRERLLRCLRGETQQQEEGVDPGEKLLDDAFATLERAQHSGEKTLALELYKQAESGFYEAEKVVPDERSREFLRARRGDLQRTIRALEREMDDVKRREENGPPPPLAAAPAQGVAAPREEEATTDISARLEELRRFAAQQDAAESQQGNRTDLAARLAALKNGPAPPVEDLTERLRRLRGDKGPADVGPAVEGGKSAVERIIEQVTDEIALGIDDDGIDEVEESDSKSEASSSSRSSDSSSGSDEVVFCQSYRFGHRERTGMEHAVHLDGERLLSVLESTVRDLELVATLPEKAPTKPTAAYQPDTQEALNRQFVVEASLLRFLALQRLQDDERPETEEDGEDSEEELQQIDTQSMLSGPVAARLFPKSLHQILKNLKGDRTARDALRKLSSTSVSPAISQLTQAWMQLIINTDTALSTSFEQDERFTLTLRDSMLRLREVEDDRDQLAFELAQAREARVTMSQKFTAQRTRLEAQLRDTKRAADDILGPTARDREEYLQAAQSSFETQKSNAQEQLESIQRTIVRVTQVSQQAEADERKHAQHYATELRELVERYDEDMVKLDAEIEQERAELDRLDAANTKFATHFARIDRDRRNMIEEQRAIDITERLRRLRDMNLFGFILKIQAAVRGFLTRRRMRLEAQRKRRKSRKKSKKGKKRSSTSPRRKTTTKKTGVKIRTKKA